VKEAILLAVVATALACAGTPEQACERAVPPPGEGTAPARDEMSRIDPLAQIFYERISNRRFNSIATFQDPALREFFLSEEAFADYFANFVQVLTDAHFEKNRATKMRIEDICIDEIGDALIRVRFWGDNSQPLRWWRVQLVRVDRWQTADGAWWVMPGKL
jgi:hypothetical protein